MAGPADLGTAAAPINTKKKIKKKFFAAGTSRDGGSPHKHQKKKSSFLPKITRKR